MFRMKAIGTLCTLFLTAQALADDSKLPEAFQGQSEDSVYEIGYDDIDSFLKSSVMVTGMSSRETVSDVSPKTGTRLKSRMNSKTALEGNRFLYQNLEDPKILAAVTAMKDSLASVPAELPLSALPRDEQLAYWLNLYNITILEQTAKALPFTNTHDLLTPGEDDYLLDKKVVTVAGVALSLNDIQFTILKEKSDSNPLIIYGLYQGNIGSPSLQPRAFTGKNLWVQLKQSANEFVNSNRGTYYDGRISAFYKQNLAYFNNDMDMLRSHLLDYVHSDVERDIASADELRFTMTDWQLASVTGNDKNHYGGSISDAKGLFSPCAGEDPCSFSNMGNIARLSAVGLKGTRRMSFERLLTFKKSIRKANEVRAKVTVTDLDSAEEGSSSIN